MDTKYICEDPLSENNYSVTGKIFEEGELVTDDFGNKKSPDGYDVISLSEFEERKKNEKKQKNKKNIKLIGAIAAGVVLIGGLVFFFSGKSSEVKTDEIATPPAKETPVVEAPVATPTTAEPVTKTEAPEAPAPKAVEEVKPVPSKKAVNNVATPKGTQTKKFPGGGKYVGEMKNGQMQGLGTFYYGQHELISPRDMKKRYAESGDYLIGEFYEGKVVSGKLYDASNTLKEVIMIGR